MVNYGYDTSNNIQRFVDFRNVLNNIQLWII